MPILRTCTQLNLHKYSKDDVCEYFRQGIEFHKNAGFDALDFPMKEIAVMLSEKSDVNYKRCIKQVKSDASNYDIRFEICHLPFTIWNRISHSSSMVKKFEKMMMTSVEAAALLDVDYAVLHPNSVTINKDDFCEEKEFEICMKHLSPIADYAKKLGVKLALENLASSYVGEDLYRYGQRAEEICKMADALGIGICWDFGHANIAGANQSSELEIVGSRLCVLHINDNNGLSDDHLLPCMGTVDWNDAMSGLKKIEFNGLLNFEIATTALPGCLRTSFAKYLMDTAGELYSYYSKQGDLHE
ncbi:MAG: sugar phosphate isomerase/epimerase [Clostridia bacterium]|nr:sugar phosphate isomerase/epimerase [Clostridia bacterium]